MSRAGAGAGPEQGRGGGTMYYTNRGLRKGPFLWKHTKRLPPIGVLQAPDDTWPIGGAMPYGWTKDGVARWRLSVHGADVPGLFVVIDRQFLPAGR